jgi:phospholipase A1
MFWHRLKGGSPEDKKFDYEKFIGNGELLVVYSFENSAVNVTYSYSFSGFDYGSVLLEYSHKVTNTFGFYARYFNGYGESLIDVEYKSNTLSVGIMVNEW